MEGRPRGAERVLLLASPQTVKGFDFVTRVPSLGLASIAGNIRGLCDVRIADLVLMQRTYMKFVDRLVERYKPDLVGLSSMTFQYQGMLNLARHIKKRLPDALIAFGGYHPTLMYEAMARTDADAIDLIVRGEAEITFREVLLATKKGSGLSGIRGLSFKEDGVFVHNEPRDLCDLSQIKLPYREARILRGPFKAFGLPVDVLETSRGCTFDCKYCSIRKMYGRSFRTYSIERVIEDIESIRRYNPGIRSIAIMDDNVTLDSERMKRICDAIVESGNSDLKYFTQASVRGIARDPELARKMKKAGFSLVFLGIENERSSNLRFLGKTGDQSESRRAVAELRRNAMVVAGGFMLGNPDDSEEDLWANFRFAKETSVEIPIFFLLTPYPGTRIREELLSAGLIVNKNDFAKYDCFTPICRTNHLEIDQIEQLLWRMYSSYLDLHWLVQNNMWRQYPRWLLAQTLRFFPKAISRRISVALGRRKEEELFEADRRSGAILEGFSDYLQRGPDEEEIAKEALKALT